MSKVQDTSVVLGSLHNLAKHSILPKEEMLNLVRHFQATSDENARQKIILNCQRLIFKLAKKFAYRSKGVFEPEDFILPGIEGIDRALNKFDPDHGTAFATYAFNWIHQSMKLYQVKHRSLIYIPMSELQKRAGGESNNYTVSVPKSIDSGGFVNRGGESEPMQIADPNANDPIKHFETMDEFRRLPLDILTDREQEILRLRFWEEETLSKIGIIHGLSAERIRQIETKAIKKLRAAIAKRTS